MNLNNSGIVPTEYKCLVLPKPVEEKTSGGILLPDMTKDHDKYATTEGRLIAVGPGAFTFMDADIWAGREPKAGQMVLFAKYAGLHKKGRDGRDYVIMNDKDLLATIEE